MPTTSTTRGQRVAHRRTACGLSQEALAYECGCTPRTIQRIERDVTDAMSQRIRNALCKRLGMSLRQLANGQRSTGRA